MWKQTNQRILNQKAEGHFLARKHTPTELRLKLRQSEIWEAGLETYRVVTSNFKAAAQLKNQNIKLISGWPDKYRPGEEFQFEFSTAQSNLVLGILINVA